MATRPRLQSEADIYHVFSRGTGGHILFEDNADRLTLLEMLSQELDRYNCELYAFCLMGNHFHLVLHPKTERLHQFMGTFQSRYAKYFNRRHDRQGHLFQGRYGSTAIMSDEHLMTVVRYVHLNPIEEKLSCSCEYRWSSYREYLRDEPDGHASRGNRIVNTRFVLSVFGGQQAFRTFHEHGIVEKQRNTSFAQCSLEDVEAVERIKLALGTDVFKIIASTDKRERNRLLRKMKQLGFSCNRIARLTGLGKSIVRRA